MTIWRITDTRYLDDAFNGVGAEKYGGRFNSVGRKLLYCSGSISLALLEMPVQADKRSRLSGHSCIPVTLDDSLIEAVDRASLPSGWDARPY